MHKKLMISAVLMMFTLGTAGAAFAADGPGGNKRKGKYTYRKLVKSCFQRGAVDSATPTVSPADRKMSEWTAVFEGKAFNGVFGCEQEWANASEKDILDIYSYFYSSAADSPTPATCK